MLRYFNHTPPDIQLANKKRFSKWSYLVPMLAAIALLASCMIVSAKKYYWNDELFSYYMTSEPSFGKLLTAFQDKLNNTPILYFLLGWVWDKLFGSAELSLRIFTSISFCAALLISWATLRRSYGQWPASIGVLLVFCTSTIILTQNGEARMYGLFILTLALAFQLYDQAYQKTRISTGDFWLNVCAHAAIAHTHLYGFFYSGAMLCCFILADRLRHLYRPKLYLSVIGGLATIIFYIPTFLIQADAGKPRTWIPAPDFRDLLDIYNVTAPSFFSRFLVLGLTVVVAAYIIWNRRKESIKLLAGEIHLLLFALAFIAVPTAVWIISLTIKPIFYPRYMIPTALGWIVLITMGVARPISGLPIVATVVGRLGERKVLVSLTSMLAIVAFFGFVLYQPIIWGIHYRGGGSPGFYDLKAVEMQPYRDLPRVMPLSGQLLERNFYSPERNKYFYILDWESALNKYSGTFPPQEFKHMQAWRRNFPERFGNNILTNDEFLARYDRFLVLDRPNYLHKCQPLYSGLQTFDLWDTYLDCPQWVETRLLNNKKYKITVIRAAKQEWFTYLLVERQPKTPATVMQ
ncbi:glycosyltransferase family 39 protein [Hymenobacter siberiensis]|uniref:glycosyltransferase family 39 protein n=1 Tax=Hymenobacter siberiensis TaxID=2848396 RepID=UPI001C1E6EF2|nr:glycosyltransferase family 39 protein [Hymenobacter siberiensis]